MSLSPTSGRASNFIHSWRALFLYSYLSFGGTFSVSCPEIYRRLSLSQRLKISMAKLVGGHIVCLLYGGVIESVMGGSTVPLLWWLTGARR